MEKITSFHNILIKQAGSLREAAGRRETGMTLIDGRREIERAFEAGVRLIKVFFTKACQDLFLKKLSKAGIEAIEVSEAVMEKLAYGERHEGIIAMARTPSVTFKDLKLSAEPLVVVLESLEKPGNLGAVLRTCDGIGVEAVFVCDPKTDIYNPNVIRSSTGTVFTVPVVGEKSYAIISFLRAKRIRICASSPSAVKYYTQENYKGAWAFVFGSEDRGLSGDWLSGADSTVKIPMKGQADSLNVSISAAVILYEAQRQRSLPLNSRC